MTSWLVSLETAKLLSQVTLDIPHAYVLRFSVKEGDAAMCPAGPLRAAVAAYADGVVNYCLPAPELHLVQKYLRDEYRIHVMVFCNACGWGWELMTTHGTTMDGYDEQGDDTDSGMWTTFEGALDAGIACALRRVLRRPGDDCF